MEKLNQIEKKESIKFLLFDSGVCLPFNKRKELNLIRNQKSSQKKVNLSLNKL